MNRTLMLTEVNRTHSLTDLNVCFGIFAETLSNKARYILTNHMLLPLLKLKFPCMGKALVLTLNKAK